MFQQITYAGYGFHNSFYGNIEYGDAPRYIHVYGAWPEEKPPQSGMLVGDWQETDESNDEVLPQQTISSHAAEIASRIAVIKELKLQVDAETDLNTKNIIRQQLRIERDAKERAFKLKAMIDEEESLFILLH